MTRTKQFILLDKNGNIRFKGCVLNKNYKITEVGRHWTGFIPKENMRRFCECKKDDPLTLMEDG